MHLMYIIFMRKIYSVHTNRLSVEYQKSKENDNEFEMNLTSFKEALAYAQKENIFLKKIYNLEVLKRDIEIIISLRKLMKPLKPDPILLNYLGNKQIMIFPIESTAKREGTAVHIINTGHREMYLDKARLQSITSDISQQEVLTLGMTENNRGEKRFLYAIKLDNTYSTIMILDFSDGSLKMVTAYSTNNNKINKIFKNCCILVNKIV